MRNNRFLALGLALVLTLTSAFEVFAVDTEDLGEAEGQNGETSTSIEDMEEITIPGEGVIDPEITVIDDEQLEEEEEVIEPLAPIESENITVSLNNNGFLLHWQAVPEAKGYLVLRKTSDEEWKIIDDTKYVYYKDTKMSAGMNKYAVVPFFEDNYIEEVIEAEQYVIDEEITDGAAISAYYIKPVDNVSISGSETTRDVSWDAADADGYEVQVSASAIFLGPITNDTADTAITVDELKEEKTYYARVRAYKTVEDVKYYSDWALSLGDNYDVDLELSFQKINNKSTNLYQAVGESYTSSKYWTVTQGGCSDGTYLYYVLENTKKKTCKIVKVRASDKKLIKKSAALKLDHGNSMTYNSKTKELVVVHNKVHYMRISFVDPSTLKVKRYKDIPKKSDIFGVGVDGSKAGERFGKTVAIMSVSYIPERDQYAFFIRGISFDMLITDANFKPEYMVTLDKTKGDDFYYQDLYTTGDYIVTMESGNLNSSCTYYTCENLLHVYDYSGKCLGTINVSDRYEIENIAVAGSTMYVGFHTSNKFPKYKTAYKWSYVKTVPKTTANKKAYTKRNKLKVVASGSNYKVYERVKYQKVVSTTFKRFGYVGKAV